SLAVRGRAGANGIPMFSMAVSATRPLVAVAGGEGEVKLLDLTTLMPSPNQLKPGAPVYGVAFHPDGTTLAMAGDAGVTLWHGVTGSRMGTPLGGAASPRAVAFSRDGQRLAVAGEGMVVWDLAAQRALTPILPAERAELPRIVLSPDGRMLWSANEFGPPVQ